MPRHLVYALARAEVPQVNGEVLSCGYGHQRAAEAQAWEGHIPAVATYFPSGLKASVYMSP